MGKGEDTEMSRESQSLAKCVRMTLTQLGIDTTGVDIMVSGSSVSIKGELKPLKASGFESEKSRASRKELIMQRLRAHKGIKYVRFL